MQAAGTAVMVPLLMTTLMTVVPEHDRGRVMGNVTLAISVAPALGPTISGVVLQWTSWRWLFGLVLPVALVITVLALRRLVNVGETKPGAIDWLSVVLAGLGFGGLVYGLSGLGEAAASTVPPVALVAAGLLLIGLFALRQRSLQKRDVPLLDLRTLTHRTFTLSLSLQAVSFLAMLGAMILLPLYLQDVRGLSPLQTGLMVAPGGIAMGLLGPSVGRAFDRFGGRPLVVPGSVGIVAALVVMSRVGETTPYAVIVGAHLLLMVSLAATFTPAFTLGLGSCRRTCTPTAARCSAPPSRSPPPSARPWPSRCCPRGRPSWQPRGRHPRPRSSAACRRPSRPRPASRCSPSSSPCCCPLGSRPSGRSRPPSR